jgi:hypothetical protein
VETVYFFSTEVEMPFQSSQDLSTQAAKQLTHALLHPQPAGPFYQVGDDKMLALELLSTIFKGALPSHKLNATSPQVKIVDSDTNLRVQITAKCRNTSEGGASHCNTCHDTKFTSKVTFHFMQSSHTFHSTSYGEEKCNSTKCVK